MIMRFQNNEWVTYSWGKNIFNLRDTFWKIWFTKKDKDTYKYILMSMTGVGSCTRNLGFGFWKCLGEMGLKQVEQGFSSIFAKCLPYLMIFQSGAFWKCCKTLKNHQIWQKMKKSLAFNQPIFRWFRVPWKSDFGYSICH